MNKKNLFLRPCGVRIREWGEMVGYLYFQNEHVVVLLNNISSKAYLGPIKNLYKKYLEPEADIFLIPRHAVDEIRFYSPKK